MHQMKLDFVVVQQQNLTKTAYRAVYQTISSKHDIQFDTQHPSRFQESQSLKVDNKPKISERLKNT